MKIVNGDLKLLQALSQPVALTMGNFDGVHLGHQYLIKELVRRAKSLDVPPVLLSFSPHPEKVFKKDGFYSLLTQEEKCSKIADLGIEILVIQDFSSGFSEVSSQDFLRQYLDHFFQIKFLLFGYDLKFGKGGLGDFEMARSFYSKKGVEVAQAPSFLLKDKIVSSSAIRDALSCGDVNLVKDFLGYKYFIDGVVVKGDAIGRTIDFPTANLSDIETMMPEDGVYAAWVHSPGGVTHKAAVNIGHRPTVGGAKRRVECHLLDFSKDLYSERLRVEFVSKIRGEQKFINLDTLKEQIARDVESVKKELGSLHG